MTDISKCCGLLETSADVQTCPLSGTCYRYKANNSPYQSWIKPPYENGACDMYWEDRNEHK